MIDWNTNGRKSSRPANEAVAVVSQSSEQLISRRSLASRWECSVETVKRHTRDGLLHPIRFNARMIRYRLSDVIRVEREGEARP
jgi:hypothetical protein